MSAPFPPLDRRAIVDLRPPKNALDAWRPYAFFVEQEAAAEGGLDEVATILLTHPECAFRCLMCDLWRNTLDKSPSPEITARQIEYALPRLPAARRLKLYNSGNFFDQRAVPRDQYSAIAKLCEAFDVVTVENHPRLCGPDVLRFAECLRGRLEVAMGLETIHPDILRSLNKQMSVQDFQRAAEYLVQNGVGLRVFLLLRPPGMSEDEGRLWALRSLERSFDCGADLCAVIPTRGGNGAMEHLAEHGWFAPPRLASLEHVLEEALSWRRGRVVADLWNIEQLAACEECRERRIDRLRHMNLHQCVQPPIPCDCGPTAR